MNLTFSILGALRAAKAPLYLASTPFSLLSLLWPLGRNWAEEEAGVRRNMVVHGC